VPARAVGRKRERPCGTGVDRAQKGVGDEHREIEARQRARLPLRGDERLDVRVVAAQRRHHRTAARARGLNGSAHRIPDVHERHRSGRGAACSVGGLARWAQRREVVADPPALLERERTFTQSLEDAVHRIVDLAHHEAVEKRHAAARTRTGENAAAR
jgi:hypothetical protein